MCEDISTICDVEDFREKTTVRLKLLLGMLAHGLVPTAEITYLLPGAIHSPEKKNLYFSPPQSS